MLRFYAALKLLSDRFNRHAFPTFSKADLQRVLNVHYAVGKGTGNNVGRNARSGRFACPREYQRAGIAINKFVRLLHYS